MQEPERKLLVVSRGAHRHGQRSAVDADLERLLDSHRIGSAVVLDADVGHVLCKLAQPTAARVGAAAASAREIARSIAASGSVTAGPCPTTSSLGSSWRSLRA